LITAIANVPAGVSVYAPVAPASGANAKLVSADATGAGGSQLSGTTVLICPIAPAVNCPTPVTATWEVTKSDSSKIETFTFNLVLMNPNSVALTGITFAGALARLKSSKNSGSK
jgi:hypothetical protein